MVKDIKIEDFDYTLPDERIARHPLSQRDACKMLAAYPDGSVRHTAFRELPSLLPADALLICNDTKVINARIGFQKATGSHIEVFLLEPLSPEDYVLNFQVRGKCVWSCLVGNLKRWKGGVLEKNLNTPEGDTLLKAERLNPTGGNGQAIAFTWDNPALTFATVLEAAGNIPIPPYLKRESEPGDRSDYQTVYADAKGSVAAPTAGLHFTPEVFLALDKRGISTGKLTLHVGAGTFQPVKSETIGEHPMHTETFTVSKALVNALIAQKEAGRPVAATGTTTVRTLESLPYIGMQILMGAKDLHVSQWEAYEGTNRDFDTLEALKAISRHMEKTGRESLTASTSIMIAPGFQWRIADILVTNFHQPQSTLLLLVSSLLGSENGLPRWKNIYKEALDNGYRFLSYGDACLFFRKKEE